MAERKQTDMRSCNFESAIFAYSVLYCWSTFQPPTFSDMWLSFNVPISWIVYLYIFPLWLYLTYDYDWYCNWIFISLLGHYLPCLFFRCYVSTFGRYNGSDMGQQSLTASVNSLLVKRHLMLSTVLIFTSRSVHINVTQSWWRIFLIQQAQPVYQ